MQRERYLNGRFRPQASSAASDEPAPGLDGLSKAHTTLQVADHPAYVAHHAEIAGSPTTVWDISWLKFMVCILVACTLLTTLAFNVSGAINAAGTINTPSNPIFGAAANSLPIGDAINGITNTSAVDCVEGWDCQIKPLVCPYVPGLHIGTCTAGIEAMSLNEFVGKGRKCLLNRQSNGTCNICFCAMFRENSALEYRVVAFDKIRRNSSGAWATIGEQMLKAKPYIDFVTDPNPLSDISGLTNWQETQARIIAILQVLLVWWKPLGVICLFAGASFLAWRYWRGAKNPVITLIAKRNICRNPVQYHFHIENLHHDADKWAGISALTELCGSKEAIEKTIKKYDSMPLLWDPKSLPEVGSVDKQDIDIFRLGRMRI